jgi:4-amino-4-deoxy-L-arabinose transferase-like glycosyltransferase
VLAPLILVTVLVRLLVATGLPLLNADGYFYAATADMYRAGDWKAALWTWRLHPLYPSVLAALETFVPDPWAAGVLLSIAGSVGAMVALFGLGLEGWGRWPARLAAFLYALHPACGDMEGRVLTERLYHAFGFWAVLGLWRSIRHASWRWGLSGGLCLGAAYLTRSESVILFAALLGVSGMFLLAPRFRRAWRGVAAATASAVLVGSPYYLALHAEFGGWMPTARGRAAVSALQGGARPPSDSVREQSIRETFGNHLGAVVNTARLAIQAYHVVPLLLVVLGLSLPRRGVSDRDACWYLLMVAGANLGAITLFYWLSLTYIPMRYLSFPTALLLPWAGWGLHRLLARLLCRDARRARGCAASVVLLVAAALLAKSVGYHRPDLQVVREAAEWVGRNGGAGKRMLATRDSIAYHGRGFYVQFEWPELRARLERGDAEFFIWEEKEGERYGAEELERLLSSPALLPLKRFGEPGKGVRVFRVSALPR